MSRDKAFQKILERLDETDFNDIQMVVREVLLKYGFPYESVVQGEVWDALDELSTNKFAKQIVQEVAEEYNNGWIPCSERLPEEHKLYDITFKNSAGIHSDSAIYNPYLKRWLWDADETELVENEILAWAEKRDPYQPKGE